MEEEIVVEETLEEKMVLEEDVAREGKAFGCKVSVSNERTFVGWFSIWILILFKL